MSESTFPNAAATGATPPAGGYDSAYGDGAVATSGDGNTVAFGSPLQSNDTFTRAGLVQVFTRSGNSFSQKGSSIIGPSASQRYGSSLALNLDGSILFVGGNNNSGTLIYEYNGSDWDLIQTLPPIKSSGEQVAITADAEYLATTTTAAIVLYQKNNGLNTYNTTVLASVDMTSTRFLDIGYDGSNANTIRILVGEPGENSFNGIVTLYRYDGTPGSALISTQTFPSTGGGEAGWGSSVSVRSDAKRLAIGSVNTGIVQVYESDDSRTVYTQFGSNITGTASYRFGIRVALSSTTNHLVIGSEYFDTGSSGTAVGKVYLYVQSGSEYVEDTSFSLTGTTGGQRLGTTVAVDDETTIIVSGSQIFNDESGATLTQDTSMCLTDSTLVQKMVEA